TVSATTTGCPSNSCPGAADGDTVNVPENHSSPVTWTTTLIVAKGITIIGQTTVDSSAGTANDLTIIKAGTGASGNQPLIRFDTVSGKSYRLSGFTFRSGRTASPTNTNGMVRFNGSS